MNEIPQFRPKEKKSVESLPTKKSPRSIRDRVNSFLKILLVFTGILFLILTGYLVYLSLGLPSIEEVNNYRPTLRTEIYDHNGKFIRAFYQENRVWAPLDSIPADLIQALVAVEDVRFYQHWGLDARRLVGAVIKDIMHLSLKEGASTLTQQLARNAFLNHEKTINRKLRELLMAIKLEQTYTKEQILELYLNEIYFGSGCYGVGTIAQRYFGKPVSQLNKAQSTFVAGLPKNPEGYNPVYHLDRGKKRHQIILSVLNRQGLITPAERDSLWQQDLEFVAQTDRNIAAAYFIEEIRQVVIEKYGPEFVYNRGIKIYTTLDLDWQIAAEAIYEAELDTLQAELQRAYIVPESVAPIQGAVLVLDPATAGVRVMIGGRDFEQSQFNRAWQAKRQPGSAFKPIVYAEAIRQGFSPADMIIDFPDTIQWQHNDPWIPRNITNKFYGPVNLRTALNRSLNLATVQLAQEVGLHKIIALAKLMGIESYIPPYPSISLGAASVSLAEMAGAYNVIANSGLYEPLHLMEKIIDEDGTVVEAYEATLREVLTAAEARVMTSMMESVMTAGSGYGARQAGFTRPAAGKSGTPTNATDGWFIGFTPQVLTAVWVGFDDNTSLGYSSVGTALPLWTSLMKAVHDSIPPMPFRDMEGIDRISICQISGQIAGQQCPEVVRDVIAHLEYRSQVDTCTSCAFRMKRPERDPLSVDKIPLGN